MDSNGIKAIIIRPFTGSLSLPDDMDLDYERDPQAEPIGGGVVAVVDGIGGYGVAVIKTGAAQLATLAGDADTVAILPLTETDGGKWPELDEAITPGGLARMNGILSALGMPGLPEGIIVRAALGAIAPGVDWAGFDIG